MPNKNYQIGYRFERRVMSYFWKRGYYVQRAYASKGVFDIIAVPPKGRVSKSFLIQAKGDRRKGYIDPSESARLKDAAKHYNAYCCIAFKEGHKLKFRLVNIYK